MAYTKYGEYIRILRVKYHEVMSDTAKLLNVKTPFVSAVESGKKNVPEEWIPKLIQHYNLNEQEQADLLNAIEESKNQMKFVLLPHQIQKEDWLFSFKGLLRILMTTRLMLL